MKKIQVAIVGYGNIGKYALAAILNSPDLNLMGVVRRNANKAEQPKELEGIPVYQDPKELKGCDVALLTVPTRSVASVAKEYLELGINTVDSFDLHGQKMVEHLSELRELGEKNNSVAVVGAGWDPGTDSLIRALVEIMAPQGLTFTNFGPGMSMGHTVAVKQIPGVEDALSMTMPKGAGVHTRLVYVKLKSGSDLNEVKKLVKADPYFKNDETYVYEVDSVEELKDVGHGVMLERRGGSGETANQYFKWEMRINNPALTAQMMVSAARASLKQAPGAYSLLQIPLADYFSADSDELIGRLV